MKLQRILYVTQGSLGVWDVRDRAPLQVAEFADDDAGIRAFDEYLAKTSGVPSALLVDVIEEEFKLQSIPKLGMRDRAALIERRCASIYRRTPYRSSLFQGRSADDPSEFAVVHSAIVNHELVDPWLQALLRHCTPISGVYSVPHLAQRVVEKLYPQSENSLFVAPHQASKLRQVFTQKGNLRSARLSHSAGLDSHSYADAVVAEVTRSRRYFERTRLLSPLNVLDVHVIANADTAARIEQLAANDRSSVYHYVDPDEAAAKLGHRATVSAMNFEEVYFSLLSQKHPSRSYAASGETRFWQMRRLRNAIIGTAVAAATVVTAIAAVLFSDAWVLRNRAAEMDLQVRHLSETFRRENERFNPIKADSYEMKLAVDSGEYILANRVPVPWVMNQLGSVLGDFPDIQASELHWEIETPPQPERRQRPVEARLPVPVTVVNAVDAVLVGKLEPFDGDLRKAFDRIDEFKDALERRTHFSSANVIAYPIDTSTSAAVTGEIIDRKENDPAGFRIRVSYQLVEPGQGDGNDPI
ncbi:MAG: hypothetical protein AAFN50_13790 [Pseudomonadota bacterium]